MDTEYFNQRIQCSRDDKLECLQTVSLLTEIALTARNDGSIRSMEELLENNRRYYSLFLANAVQVFMDAKEADQIRDILCNSIVCSNLTGRKFLNAVIITEVLAALYEKEDQDFIFFFLVPSFFGIEFQETVREAFRTSRRAILQGGLKPASPPEPSTPAAPDAGAK